MGLKDSLCWLWYAAAPSLLLLLTNILTSTNCHYSYSQHRLPTKGNDPAGLWDALSCWCPSQEPAHTGGKAARSSGCPESSWLKSFPWTQNCESTPPAHSPIASTDKDGSEVPVPRAVTFSCKNAFIQPPFCSHRKYLCCQEIRSSEFRTVFADSIGWKLQSFQTFPKTSTFWVSFPKPAPDWPTPRAF